MNNFFKQSRGVGLVLCAAGAFILTSPARGASFDCAKAQSKVEKLICADAELSRLDEELAQAYTARLQDKTRTDTTRQTQKQWIRVRNACGDATCVKQSYHARLHALSIGGATKLTTNRQETVEDGEEAKKAIRIQEALGRHRYKLTHALDRSLCEGLFNAMQTNSPEVVYIEPVLRTDNPEHPGLARYEACYRDERPRGESSFGLCAVGTRRFRLYQLDMDGSPSNGLEEYLYGQEPDCHPQAPAAQYAKVNLETCQHQEVLGVAPESPNGWNGYADGSINALIQFRGEYLVIDARNYDEAGVGVTALAYNKRVKGFKSPYQCTWHSAK